MNWLSTLSTVTAALLTAACCSIAKLESSDVSRPEVVDKFVCEAPADVLPDPSMGTVLVVATDNKRKLNNCITVVQKLKEGVSPYVKFVAEPQ